MRRRWTTKLGILAAAASVPLLLTGCIGAGGAGDPSDRYTINRVTAAEVAIGNDAETRFVNRNVLPGTAERQIAAYPGLGEAIRRNGIDIREIVSVRVRPTNVVDVFLR